MKGEEYIKKYKDSRILIILLGIFCVVLIYVNITTSYDYERIDGFVYKEIEWQEQTINVIKENCEFGMWIDDYTEPGFARLKCRQKVCIQDGFCKEEEWISPIRTKIKEVS